MTDTTAAVTAAREALDANGEMSGVLDASWTVRRLVQSDAALRGLLAMVDRLTAPPSDEEIGALAKVAQAAIQRDHGNTNAHYAEVEGEAVAAAIVAASGRRHLPTETEWEYAWEADEVARAAKRPRGPRLMVDGVFYTPEQIAEFPRGRRVRRRPAGPWEVCDEQ